MSSYLSDVSTPYYLKVIAELIDETWEANGGVDAFAFSGTSGISVYMALNTLFPGKYMGIFIRKENVPSHGDPIECSRELQHRVIVGDPTEDAVEVPEIKVSFLDDFVCSGRTKNYVRNKVLNSFKGVRFVTDTLWNEVTSDVEVNAIRVNEIVARVRKLMLEDEGVL